MIKRRRKLNRKVDYDYSQDGWYFVTIVTKDRENLFGEIENNEMILNKYGETVNKFWHQIPSHFPYSKLYEFIIMPNHVHGIVEINNSVGNADLRSLRVIDRTKMKLSKIIHGYKSSITRNIRKNYNDYEFGWQKSFHDRIIRTEDEYVKIKNYIISNPINWKTDKNNLLNQSPKKK
jgi:putative transposase